MRYRVYNWLILGIILSLVLTVSQFGMIDLRPAIANSGCEETELSFDDDYVDIGWLCGGQYCGGIVQFTPPTTPWVVSKVKVMAWIELGDAPFWIEIWDSNHNELFHGEYMYSDYFTSSVAWVEIEIPHTFVQGDFYVGFFGNWSESHKLWLGADNDSPISYHSFVGDCDVNTIAYGNDWNWMIRAIGCSPQPADAGSATVDTLATVSGEADNSPYVCAKWETPDHYPELSGTQVNPVPGGMRTVKFYVVVGDTNGIQDVDAVYIKVLHPDQSFKFQLDAFRGSWTVIPWGGMIDMDGDCTPDTPLSTALDQLDAEKRITYGFDPVRGTQMDLDKLKYDLEHNKQFLVELVGYFDYHQPCGWYTVEALVTDGHGGLGTLLNWMKFESIVALRIDFSLIDFDEVNPNEWNILYGDEDLTTPTKLTIQNIGNDPAMIQLHASVMVGETHMKEITTFDAYMLGGYIEFEACVPTLIADESGPVMLLPCTTTQIDFSVHPSEFVLPDTYRGTMTVTILHHPCD